MRAQPRRSARRVSIFVQANLPAFGGSLTRHATTLRSTYNAVMGVPIEQPRWVYEVGVSLQIHLLLLARFIGSAKLNTECSAGWELGHSYGRIARPIFASH